MPPTRRLFALALAVLSAAAPLWAGDWSGAYAGGQVGRAGGDGFAGGTNSTYGLHGGYDFVLGGLVLGGELEFERMELPFAGGGGALGNVGRIKLRAGHDFGPAMAYAIMGGVSGEVPSGNETGVVFGLGLATQVGRNMTLSGEALRQVFDNFANGGASARTDSFNVRVSFRF